MTKTAVLSDIHGNLPALIATVADAEARGCTRFLNLGDILSGPLWPAETAEWLMARDWPTIAGNHERQVLTDTSDRINASDAFTRAVLGPEVLAWMAALPATLMLEDMFLCHGTPTSDVTPLTDTLEGATLRAASEAELAGRLAGQGAPLILCGHTHVPRLLALPGGRRVLNPGSVGLQAYDDDHPLPYTVENGDPLARYAVIDGEEISLHAVAYDHLAAARKAEAEGRADWAIGLATGRMA
ncbi:metallophosphoesterase family protein [Sphingomonas kyeonggiensis]|uniref:Diadenosine tetraphosphatase ApaH/serine/threonine PP2A family protein phosphatase n=1 Tax=Sphingomonas kyeonggiensis TaxID=1268553 RepID=A0A7W6JPN8_9SPHN|nr:metallophosphoesterase family protein [Sphingomonas kyeonggiensis]MBB4097260.1 diadenosine tetraphosphatase ApaH/serine/threonine PP2A family protein phosphatase [Sphingomonas kyeonggiensis]